MAGPGLASAAEPVSDHGGTVTVACESAVWAHEMELLGADLVRRLNAALEGSAIEKLRFQVGSAPNRR